MIARLSLAVAIFALSACETFGPVNSGDVVRARETAILIAAKACNDLPAHTNGLWFADLRDGVWDVRFHARQTSSTCDLVHVHISAATGKADDCEICVITD